MNVTCSAPGKLVLLGEYAVLEGAPAVSMAVNRRAVVRLGFRPGAKCEVSAPDILDARLPFVIDADGLPDWREAGDKAAALGLVDQVLRGLAAERLAPPPGRGFGLELDTQEFFDRLGSEPLKLGLGSSAALTVALATALAAQAGHAAVTTDQSTWLHRLLALHRGFQGGQGSGVDVATSLVGGVISYRLSGAEGPVAQTLVWPDALQRLFVWSGKSASTPQFLTRLQAWRGGHPAEYSALMSKLRSIAETAVVALTQGDAAGFIDAAAAYAAGLNELGRASAVSIFSPEHLRIAALAAELGLVYKPCGAGGGDVGVAFAMNDAARLDALRLRLHQAGFASVPLAVDECGLKLDCMEIMEIEEA